MTRRWVSGEIWTAIAAAMMLASGGAFASPPVRSQASDSVASTPLGDVVDAASPALYRLPRLSSFAPSPGQAVMVESPTVVTAPVPPSKSVTATRPDTAQPVCADRTDQPQQLPQVPPVAPDRTETPRLAAVDTAAERSEPLFGTPPMEAASVPVAVPPSAVTLPAARPIATRSVSTTTELTPQIQPAVQRGYALAQRGAMYAARAEFVQVLRRIAQAKDAAANSDAHSRALAAGLRAIDEAEDFVPDGVRVEAELDVRLVASSHRTPVLGERPEGVSPHEAVALYHGYAQGQLAAAVGGEQAGSMVLHGLGKVAATLAERSGGDAAMRRSALTMYSAALVACPANHLATNELGVLLMREGRAEEAARLFERTIDLAPSATAYHNLSVAQAKLGFYSQATANEGESQRLASLERSTGAVSRRAGIEWVSPDEMAGIAQPALQPTAHLPPPPKSVWQKTVDIARSLPLVGGTKTR